MQASQQAWIAQQHGAAAIGYSLERIPDLAPGAVLALALDLSVGEDAIKAALSGFDVQITAVPEVSDLYVLATKRGRRK